MSTADDDALRWEGDEHLDPPAPDAAAGDEDQAGAVDAGDAQPEPAEAGERQDSAAARTLPDGFTAVGRGSDEIGRVQDDGSVIAPGEPASLSSTMLVTLGVIAGVYVLFTIGWIVGGLRLQGTAQFLVSQVGYQFALWLAVAAPALWFAATYALTRAAKNWVRVAWLLGGLALLLPWPFIMVGAVGR